MEVCLREVVGWWRWWGHPKGVLYSAEEEVICMIRHRSTSRLGEALVTRYHSVHVMSPGTMVAGRQCEGSASSARLSIT